MNIAIIPARAGSKGLKGKNWRYLDGKPLISYTIEAAIASKLFDKIVVTTDSDEIRNIGYTYPINVLRRPEYLSTDDVPLAPVLIHALDATEVHEGKLYDTVCCLQATSPLRTEKHIIEAFQRFHNKRTDSLVSVCEELHSIWTMNKGTVVTVTNPKVNRQQAHPYYIGNGAISITRKQLLLARQSRVGGRLALFPMDKISSTDVHTIEDIELCEFFLKRFSTEKSRRAGISGF